MNLLLTLGLFFGANAGPASHSEAVGDPVDIAPSAYKYRADRKAESNAPESWFALMHYARLPLNKPVDQSSPAIKRALCAFLWEEIRPIQTVELSWPPHSKHRPSPENLTITTLMNVGASSSWWNNLNAVIQTITPTVSDAGSTLTFAVGQNTCGLVVSVAGDHEASEYEVPQVRVLTPQTWKQMDLEIEWGFDKATSTKDYSGRLETYDGRISNLRPLAGDTHTLVTFADSFRSTVNSDSRRGVQMSLLYMGASKWRKTQPYTTQAEDVARTIVTVWTKSGNFSFLAADLENGPIYAPEYGFFVRRTSEQSSAPNHPASGLRMIPTPLLQRMDSIAGNTVLKGWGSDATPWFGANPTDRNVEVQGIHFAARRVAMHPGQDADVVVEWHSPIKGTVMFVGGLAHAQSGGNGVDWWLVHDTPKGRIVRAHNSTQGTGGQIISTRRETGPFIGGIDVEPGDTVSLVVGPKGDHRCDTVIINFEITELGSKNRSWFLGEDVSTRIQEGNSLPDQYGNPGVWQFASELPILQASEQPSSPPFPLQYQAKTARDFVNELGSRGLKTIREKTRLHPEQTWEGAVNATRGDDLPPHPKPPTGSEPSMSIHVPDDRLNAQWNLGAWHLLRHCATHPTNGRLWFNDFPYGILAAETYLVLSVLDQMGSHAAAADGFDQWLSLPLDRNPAGTAPAEALPDHPVGNFSEGHGALTYAVGPDGYGGQMDGIHAFGPGSIGWALTQHYWMTGDKEWLKASAPRMQANAEWMLRQRHLLSSMVPAGERLWCNGLQPALQVTPDSGGLWMQFYECEAYYWASVSRLAETIGVIDPVSGAELRAKAEAYRKELRAAVERSIALSPVVPVRDGTFHSVVPFACYCRGLSNSAWGYLRDGSGSHVGPLYWDTVQTAAALISPAGLLPANDVRVQGYLDVLEDRLLLENQNVGNRDWFQAGWQYQGGLERQANMHLAGDDVPVFLRSFLNCYAVDILPKDGYVFNEHAVHGPPDKIFEEAAFLERFRNLLIMEDGQNLWLCRAAPRSWLEQGKQISVENAPSAFGPVSYEIESDVTNDKIHATIVMPPRSTPKEVRLRLRHPASRPIRKVVVNGKPWSDFDSASEVVKLHGLHGKVKVDVAY